MIIFRKAVARALGILTLATPLSFITYCDVGAAAKQTPGSCRDDAD